jgi:geranylgeranyl pyrophosphate synthase
MDNDDLRRGRPTAHRQYDEATALLAGDALLTHAFALLSARYSADPGLACALVRELALAAGSEHLIGGQMEDLLAEKQSAARASSVASPAARASSASSVSSSAASAAFAVSAEQLEYIDLNKTAAIITAALAMGGLCGGLLSGGELDTLRALGRELGHAFQIVDDILDATADSATLGKTPGKDARSGKATYVSLHGIEGARRHAAARTQAALDALARLPGDTGFLRQLVATMLDRKN